MIVVPQAFFKADNVEVVLREGENAMVRKIAKHRNVDNDRYLSAHAMTIVHAGELLLQIPNGPVVKVPAGKMVFIPRGIYMITDIIPDDHPFEATVLFFSDSLMSGFCRKFNSHGASEFPKTPMAPKTFHFREELEDFVLTTQRYYSAKDSWIVANKLEEFLYLLLRSGQGNGFQEVLAGLSFRRKESIQTFMERNYDKPLKIEDYAYLTGRSVASFHRDFKGQFGISPKTWLLDKRLGRTKSMLSETNMTVRQLANEAGYENTSHFIKAFQKQYGISPKQYQLQQKRGLIF